MTEVSGLPYSDEFWAAIDAQDFELALSIRDRDRQANAEASKQSKTSEVTASGEPS